MMAQQICPRCIQYGGNAKTKMRIRSGKVWWDTIRLCYVLLGWVGLWYVMLFCNVMLG
jgi:hypothetical protein